MSNWSCSQGSHTKGDLLQIQEMKLQNEQLRQIIRQLQNNLDTTNEQLAQALETASTVNGLHEEITNLKLQLQKSNETGERTKSTLRTQLVEISNKADEERARLTQQIQSQSKDIAKYKKSAAENGKERDILAEELSTTKNELKICIEKNGKLTKAHQKSKDKGQKLAEQLDQLTQKFNDLSSVQEQLALENKGQAEKIETLEEEIQKLKTENTHLADDLKSKTEKAEDFESALATLQEHYNTQKNDFEQLSDEREKLVTLVQKLNSMISEYESEIETLKTENTSLTAKAKKATALTAKLFEDNFDINAIKYPFDDDLNQRIAKILSFDHFQSTQKIQLIINECAKDLAKVQEDNEALEADNAEKLNSSEEIKHKFEETYNLLNSIIREWKNLEANEHKIDACAFCYADDTFLTFLAEEGFKLENLSECFKFLGPLFVPQELFELNEECFLKRKALVDEVAQNNKDLATLMAALFLTNERLKKQNDMLIEAAEQKDAINGSLKQLGIENINTAPDLFEALKKKLQHLKDTRREIHMALVAARNELNSKNKEEEEMKKQIDNLRSSITQLETENKSLHDQLDCLINKQMRDEQERMDIMKLTKPREVCDAVSQCEKKVLECKRDDKLVIDRPSTSTPTTTTTTTSTTIIQDDHAIKMLQKALQEKVQENEELRSEVSNLKEQLEDEVASLNKKHEKAQLVLANQVHELQEALEATTKKLSQTRKKSKAVFNEMKATHEQELQSAAQSVESARVEFEKQVAEARERAEKAAVLAKNLQENLAACESKIAKIDEENVALRKEIQQSEMRNQQAAEKFTKEQKSAAAQQNVKMLNIETQHQKEIKEMKAKLEADKQRAIEFFTSHLGALYGIIDLDFDESSLTRLFTRIQADLSKLKFFQEQATKL